MVERHKLRVSGSGITGDEFVYADVVLASDFDEALDLLLGAQTHLLDGDNSIWRNKLDDFILSHTSERAKSCKTCGDDTCDGRHLDLR